ncbi:hypothetical protein [Stutzerimonas kunmingensis]|uniref:hypothetical protein n=1 Tax=Stutzerimonas kunmingensis TaxID=1211807 RepID=UPI001F395EE2|nr:hypothetical protein [Stutzerimonas kunmingensis]UIP32702.1 hypothetical protein LW136_21750 [Stutzerimonas kunmingensis]
MNASAPTASYANSAYRSNAIPAQPPHKWSQDADRTGPIRTQLRWGHYANLEPWQDVDAQLQPDMRGYLDKKKEDNIYINQKRWNFDNTSKWMILIPYFKYSSLFFISWGFWMLSLGGALANKIKWIDQAFGASIGMAADILLVFFSMAMMGLSAWLVWGKDNPRYKEYLVHAGIGFAVAIIVSLLTFQASPYGVDLFWLCAGMAFSVFMGLIGWDYLQDLYLRIFAHDGSGFNRQTGMLTIGRRFQKPFSAPFYEFDATLEFRPGPLGNSGFAIWLHHRYTSVEVFLGGKIQSLGMSLEEAMAFWDTLQRYMDVTQPLPELPILEQFRHLDPTTAEHDRQSKRDPRRWRDMPYRVWERRSRAEMIKLNRVYKWQEQPCILQAKIDPNLGIETYYRQQEAKGIQATPKGDDYDNIHRG